MAEVAYRGAASIIAREKAGDVDALLAELKALKVKLSRVWIKKLESLKKQPAQKQCSNDCSFGKSCRDTDAGKALCCKT